LDDPVVVSSLQQQECQCAWASIDSCSTCEAGVFLGRRQTWSNNEWRLSAM